MPAHAGGVVSLNLCTDQWLLLLAPQRIAALTPLSRDPRLSPYAAQAARFPVVRADAEAVLALHPDLILAAPYGAQTTLAVLRARGLRVVILPDPQDFPAIAGVMQKAGQLLAAPAQAAALIAALRDALPGHGAAGAPVRRGRALIWQARGMTQGPGTLGDAVLRAAGFENIGQGGSMDSEAVIAAHPDLLVTDTSPAYPSRAEVPASLLAGTGLRVISLNPAWLACGGPYAARAAAVLAQ